MSKLLLTLLGKPQIYLNDLPLTALSSAKAKAVLFYLVVEQSAVSRELLSGLLWSDMRPEAARASLRVVLSKLRGTLEPFISINRRDVALKASANIESDIANFADNPNARQAITIYTGPFLDDFYLKDAPLFDEWVARKREFYKQLILDRLKVLAQQATTSGNLDQAILDLRALLQLEPWREEAHRELMKLYAQTGQRTAALAQFDLCSNILKSELDIAPDSETVQLFERIKAGVISAPPPKEISLEPSKAISAPNNLPVSALSFVGRTAEQKIVTHQLNQPNCRILTICGAGGMGKTRLATECAHQLLPHFKDGVFLASLVATAEHQLVPSVIAQALSFLTQGRRSIKDQLIDYLSNKELLLILDNFEHLLGGIGLLLDLIANCPQLKILITSREPLAIQEEFVLPLTGLPYQKEDSDSPAFDLFVKRAKRLDLSFSVENAATEVDAICQMVEGMPLAIELAAAWVRVIPCQEIAAEISKNFDFLTTDLNIVPSHQHSVRAVFEYSWSLLNIAEQNGLAQLAVFKGSFTRPAADQVAHVDLRTLSTLIDKSLVQKEKNGRYAIHPLIQQFALEKLSDSDRDQTFVRLASFFGHNLQSLEPDMYTAQDDQLLKSVELELDNIRFVWDWLAKHRTFETFIEQLLPITGHFFQRRNLFIEGANLFEKLLNGAGEWSAECEAHALVHAAGLDIQLGRLDIGEQKLLQSIPILQQADQIEPAADAFYYLGITFMRKGVYEQAHARLQDSLALFSTLQNRRGTAKVNNVLGIVCATEGKYAQAEKYYAQSLKTHQELGYTRGIANLLSNLGSTYGRNQDYEKSLDYFLQAADVAQQDEEKMSKAVILSNLGSVSRELGDFETSVNYYHQSMKIFTELGDKRWMAANHNGLGTSFLDMRNFQKAWVHLTQGLEIAYEINAIPDTMTAMAHLGELAAATLEPQTAATWLAFVLNQPTTPEVSRRVAETALKSFDAQLSDKQKQEIAHTIGKATLEQIKDAIFSQVPK